MTEPAGTYAPRIGGILQAGSRFRHMPAQSAVARGSRLDRAAQRVTVEVADMPWPVVSHLPGLIRTLTLSGRVGAPSRTPGFFTFSKENQCFRRSSAHFSRDAARSLNDRLSGPTSVGVNLTGQRENASCSVPDLSLRRLSSQGFRLAATRPANRPFSVRALAQVPRPYSTAILSQGRLSVPLATSSTANNTPIAADRNGRFGVCRIGSASSRHRARAGYGLRPSSCSTFSQTKDHPCSRRS